jgi:predicted DNA binding CopG/RHH family protein
MAKNSKILDGELRVRTSEKDLIKFMKKSEKENNKPYQIFIREIITAFNEDRLRIVKPDGQKSSNVYVNR